MAFFCSKTGVRIVAPGVSVSAGGDVPEHGGSEQHDAAESAAARVLVEHHPHANDVPGPKAIAAACAAAVVVLGSPERSHDDEPPSAPSRQSPAQNRPQNLVQAPKGETAGAAAKQIAGMAERPKKPGPKAIAGAEKRPEDDEPPSAPPVPQNPVQAPKGEAPKVDAPAPPPATP